MNTNAPVALVTGANKGIGFQIAKELVGHGFRVFVGARDHRLGLIAAQAIGPDATAVQLDVTDPESVHKAADFIGQQLGRLDVLINNAGIARPLPAGTTVEQMRDGDKLGSVPMEDIRTVFETNVFGALTVTKAMLPLLRKAGAARIVNVSSIGGSMTLKEDPADFSRSYVGVYQVTKAALNAITQALAIELEGTPIKVNAVCPGFTATDLSAYAPGAGTVEDAARQPVRLALLGDDVPNGTFSNSAGPIPW